jgi:hypothetical protein
MNGSLIDKLHHIFIENGADFFTEIFFKQISPSHWTTALTPQPWKVMPSVVGVLALLSLARFLGERRDRITWLILIALFFGALPGITSSMAERRIGAVFVLFIILAAREAAWLARFMERSAGRYFVSTLRVVTPVVIGAYLATLSGAYFFFTTRGIPRQQAIGKVFQDNVRDNYLLIDLTGQLGCDLFHAVHRQIKASDCKVSFVSSKYAGEFSALQLIENPHFDKNEWWYSEKGVTDLGVCTDWPTRKWQGATFFITETKEANQWVEMLKQRFPNGKLEEVKVSYIPYHEEKVIVFTTPL